MFIATKKGYIINLDRWAKICKHHIMGSDLWYIVAYSEDGNDKMEIYKTDDVLKQEAMYESIINGIASNANILVME